MSSCELYAFLKECDGREIIKERLRDHLVNTAKVIREGQGGKALAHLSKLSELPMEAVTEAMVTAGALHDIGKALYQNNVRKDEREGCSILSFPGHEIISAYVVWNLRESAILTLHMDDPLHNALLLTTVAVL
ncbi:MAG: HD domain-containing protein, partial [Desulfurococcales archaeon]|nr:HD domain-containing protein [Desulfurococcales archaeon]